MGDVQAYLAWRLTGRWATSHASADTLGLFDLQRMDWSAELLDLAGVRVRTLPDLVPAGDVLGTVSGEVARSLGLPVPVPLVAGIGDGQAAGLGLGATAPGVAYLNLGTSMVLGGPVATITYGTRRSGPSPGSGRGPTPLRPSSMRPLTLPHGAGSSSVSTGPTALRDPRPGGRSRPVTDRS